MCGRNEVRITEDQMWTTKRRCRNEHHKRLAEIRNRSQQSLQTFVSFYLLNKMSWNIRIILLVQFSKYLESFSIIQSGIRYIWHKQFGLVFIETPCTLKHQESLWVEDEQCCYAKAWYHTVLYFFVYLWAHRSFVSNVPSLPHWVSFQTTGTGSGILG